MILHRLDPARILDELGDPRAVAAPDALSEGRSNLAYLEGGMPGGGGRLQARAEPDGRRRAAETALLEGDPHHDGDRMIRRQLVQREPHAAASVRGGELAHIRVRVGAGVEHARREPVHPADQERVALEDLVDRGRDGIPQRRAARPFDV